MVHANEKLLGTLLIVPLFICEVQSFPSLFHRGQLCHIGTGKEIKDKARSCLIVPNISYWAYNTLFPVGTSC